MSAVVPKGVADVLRPPPHPDRIGLPRWLLASLALTSPLAAGLAGALIAHRRVPTAAGFGAGFVITLLGLLGLRSVSVRLIARLSLLFSAVMLVRFGLLAGSLVSGGQLLLAWLVAAAAVLVLSDRVGTEATTSLGRAADPAAPVVSASGSAAAPGPTARTTLVVAAVIVVLVVLAMPWVLPHVGKPTQAGRGAQAQQSGVTGSLRASDQLDMTTRPDLTDEVMFTVEADRATFWRGETFDLWDGRTWTRSDGTVASLPPGTPVDHSSDDIGAGGSDVVRQRIRIETGYSDIVYAAASADRVEVDRPVGQRGDGTLVAAPLGQGTTYTVTSRRLPLTEARLRAADGPGSSADPVPASIAGRYAQPPRTSARVLAAAREATRGATTTYDRVLAMQDWMGKRTTYSLDAPLAPKGVDVVDNFLFESRQGWCEQIASSLVVLARAEGIPARLVTGFVPGERDRLSGAFTVRARDAHAWAEVWFPGVGWVPFDPTADVPLAGADRAQQTLGAWLLDHAVVILLSLAALVLVTGPLRSFLRGVLHRRRAARRPTDWAVDADAALDALGRRLDRPRLPGESASAYAHVVADGYHDDRLLAVGRAIDDSLFAARGPTDEVCSSVDATLAELGDTPVPATTDAASEARPQGEPVSP